MKAKVIHTNILLNILIFSICKIEKNCKNLHIKKVFFQGLQKK